MLPGIGTKPVALQSLYTSAGAGSAVLNVPGNPGVLESHLKHASVREGSQKEDSTQVKLKSMPEHG